jgi:YidC/Oxa1 family membrane protein insertase
VNIFDVFIINPIFNALLFLYGYIGDFGLSIIIFTIFIRLALWPLIKKQLHQTKLMRKVQPELKRIKKQTKGNRQLEAQMMMELYREKGIKPFSSIGVLLIQLPIFIAIYQVINIITNHQNQIEKHLYGFIKDIPRVNDAIIAGSQQFSEKLFGVLDLTQTVFSNQQFHIALFVLAIITAVLQYIQTKQLMPDQKSQKKLRDILKEASTGKEADQSEIMSSMSNSMALFMPFMLFAFALYLPGAVVLYYATSSFIAIIQQYFALKQDEEEMIDIADEEKPTERQGKNGTVVRIKKAQHAKIISKKKTKKRSKGGKR